MFDENGNIEDIFKIPSYGQIMESNALTNSEKLELENIRLKF